MRIKYCNQNTLKRFSTGGPYYDDYTKYDYSATFFAGGREGEGEHYILDTQNASPLIYRPL